MSNLDALDMADAAAMTDTLGHTGDSRDAPASPHASPASKPDAYTSLSFAHDRRRVAARHRDKLATQKEQAETLLRDLDAKLVTFDDLDSELVEARAAAATEALEGGHSIPITEAPAALAERLIERANINNHRAAITHALAKINGELHQAQIEVDTIQSEIDDLALKIIVGDAENLAAELVAHEDKAFGLRRKLNALGTFKEHDGRRFVVSRSQSLSAILRQREPIHSASYTSVTSGDVDEWRKRLKTLREVGF